MSLKSTKLMYAVFDEDKKLAGVVKDQRFASTLAFMSKGSYYLVGPKGAALDSDESFRGFDPTLELMREVLP